MARRTKEHASQQGVWDVPVTTLLEEALGELEYLRPGEEFLVRDLFKGYEWNRIPISFRLKLGTLFLTAVTAPGNGYKVEPYEKTSANQQKYIKQKS